MVLDYVALNSARQIGKDVLVNFVVKNLDLSEDYTRENYLKPQENLTNLGGVYCVSSSKCI